ncbi:OsmC-like protein [Ceraceosorus guamensis]|uniref:OsmC-like protein n=1 Tax=Ceraceosorus guamensis TaxID=1522189 RepID=A0A316VSE5_9BASI|nr:OsmC-like protein [Ceraceosorus guamensis]PWN39333.1 OsmC-like protein [Ceraceosorus guamensis]
MSSAQALRLLSRPALAVKASGARASARQTPIHAGLRAFSSSLPALDPKYTTAAKASGAGRNGKTELIDAGAGSISSVKLAMPKELGGQGDGNNPEQLFALGYSACFLSALQLYGRTNKLSVPDDLAITTQVTIAKDDTSFGLAVQIKAKSGKADKSELKKLLEGAHQVCPYSKATRGNIPVELHVE